eukprot:5766643-Pyramimonas_sp.AAC.1
MENLTMHRRTRIDSEVRFSLDACSIFRAMCKGPLERHCSRGNATRRAVSIEMGASEHIMRT